MKNRSNIPFWQSCVDMLAECTKFNTLTQHTYALWECAMRKKKTKLIPCQWWLWHYFQRFTTITLNNGLTSASPLEPFAPIETTIFVVSQTIEGIRSPRKRSLNAIKKIQLDNNELNRQRVNSARQKKLSQIAWTFFSFVKSRACRETRARALH